MASPPRLQPQTTPATRAELTSVSSDMRTHMERMEERIGARMERQNEMNMRQNEMNMQTMQEMLVQTMQEMLVHQQQ